MVRVVKVGGSLLSWSPTKERLKQWLRLQPQGYTVLIAGGGKMVDQVRDWDATYGLGAEVCHRMAMQCMSTTLELLSQWFPKSKRIDRLDRIPKLDTGLILLDTRQWVLRNAKLPASWDLTSDSISAAVASELNADELVLLKSGLPADSERGYCDPLFSRMVTTERVRFVSLRSEEFAEVPYVAVG